MVKASGSSFDDGRPFLLRDDVFFLEFFELARRNERLICNCIVLQTISQLFLRSATFGRSCNDYGIQPSLSS